MQCSHHALTICLATSRVITEAVMHQWLYIINHTNTALTSRITHAAVAQQAYSQLGPKPKLIRFMSEKTKSFYLFNADYNTINRP